MNPTAGRVYFLSKLDENAQNVQTKTYVDVSEQLRQMYTYCSSQQMVYELDLRKVYEATMIDWTEIDEFQAEFKEKAN